MLRRQIAEHAKDVSSWQPTAAMAPMRGSTISCGKKGTLPCKRQVSTPRPPRAETSIYSGSALQGPEDLGFRPRERDPAIRAVPVRAAPSPKAPTSHKISHARFLLVLAPDLSDPLTGLAAACRPGAAAQEACPACRETAKSCGSGGRSGCTAFCKAFKASEPDPCRESESLTG